MFPATLVAAPGGALCVAPSRTGSRIWAVTVDSADIIHTTPIGALPVPLSGHVCAMVGNTLWAVGGCSSNGTLVCNAFRVIFDLPVIPPPTPGPALSDASPPPPKQPTAASTLTAATASTAAKAGVVSARRALLNKGRHLERTGSTHHDPLARTNSDRVVAPGGGGRPPKPTPKAAVPNRSPPRGSQGKAPGGFSRQPTATRGTQPAAPRSDAGAAAPEAVATPPPAGSGAPLSTLSRHGSVASATPSPQCATLCPQRLDVFRIKHGFVMAASATVSLDTSTTVLLCFGGLTPSVTSMAPVYTNRTQAFLLEGGAQLDVVQYGDVPPPRAAAGLCLRDGQANHVLLFGGRNEKGCLDDLYVGTVSVNEGTVRMQWGEVQRSQPWPSARCGHQFVRRADGVLLFGGTALKDASTVSNCRTNFIVKVKTDEGPDGDDQPAHLCRWTELTSATCTLPRGMLHAALWVRGSDAEPGGTAVTPGQPQHSGVATVTGASANIDAPPTVEFSPWNSSGHRARSVSPAKPEPVRVRFTVPFVIRSKLNVGVKKAALDVKNTTSPQALRRDVFRVLDVKENDNYLLYYTTDEEESQLAPLHLPHVMEDVLSKFHAAGETLQLTVVEETPPTMYQALQEIGRGNFGVVYKAINMHNNVSFAIKRVRCDPTNDKAAEALVDEIRMMRQLRHRNLVQYLGAKREREYYYIFMELVAGETLESLSRACQMSTRQIQLCVRQILDALAFLHSYNVVHRDVKGANVLRDNNGVMKLSDFGTAKLLNPHGSGDGTRNAAGTAVYMAPEVMQNERTTTAADIWSLGCLVVELYTRNHPFHEKKFEYAMQVFYHVGQDKNRPATPHNAGPDAEDFLSRCFHFAPSGRWTARQLLEHPFVTNIVAAEDVTPTQSGQGLPSSATSTWRQGSLATHVLAENSFPVTPPNASPEKARKTGR